MIYIIFCVECGTEYFIINRKGGHFQFKSNLASLLSKSSEPVVDMHNNDCVICSCCNSRKKLKLAFQIILLSKICRNRKNHHKRSIATSSSSAMLDWSPPAWNSITHPTQISTPNIPLFSPRPRSIQ